MLILNAEARRKDHWQMMAHHVITVILVIGSYSYNYTRVGCLIMFLMDLCDIFLPVRSYFLKPLHEIVILKKSRYFYNISLRKCSAISH